jgi:hypothetical protein
MCAEAHDNKHKNNNNRGIIMWTGVVKYVVREKIVET